MKEINFKDIIVPNFILNSVPYQKKLEYKRKRFNQGQICPISVNKDNILTNGYITWLLYKEQNYDGIITVKESVINPINEKKHKYKKNDTFKRKNKITYKNSPTLYIWGKHKPEGKEYVWRVRNNLIDYLDMEPGDLIIVPAKNKVVTVEITKFDVLDQPPYEKRIRKVLHFIKRGEEQ